MSEPELCAGLQDCHELKTVRWTGTWQLAPRRAMSLMPRKNSQLLIVQGCAWITGAGVRRPWGWAAEDLFLVAGQSVEVPAGAHVVMESHQPAQVLHFDWREMPPGLTEPHAASPALPQLAGQWVLALGQLGRATVRLLCGLWGRQGREGRPNPVGQWPA